MPANDQYETLAIAAARVQCSQRTLRRYIAAGLLPAQRIGPRAIRVRASDVESLLRPIPTAGTAA